MTQCPQCLNELENARTCNVCGMVNMRYKPPQKNWITMSGGGFFNGVPAYTNWVQKVKDAPKIPTTVFPEEKKESIFSKIKTLYHKFD